VDLKTGLDQLDFHQGVLQFRLRVGGQRGPGPVDVLAHLELAELQAAGYTLTRSEVEIEGQPVQT
jgi:hypothetical protein